ncbi:hypothetical protein [Microbacterium cremeum]|uniref:hypothetical protein n=1 Tax=Microbacterium cremeum TaxID=2782169 RepID=UPI00188798A9|nr:hypothetical protein [Microbacterium cremeum]
MTVTKRDHALSKGDVVAMWIFITAGIVLVGATAISGVARVVGVLSGGPITVPALFAGTIAEAPIGPDGEPRRVGLDTALLMPDELSIAGVGALIIEQAVSILSLTCVLACLIAVTISVMRGRVFSRRNTALVATAGIAGLAGVAGVPFFGNMVANDAFRSISDGTFDNVVMSVPLGQLFVLAFVVAMMTTVFTVGDRLQRETELLV